MAANKTQYKGANTLSGRSPIIWADFSIDQVREDTDLGDVLWENWTGLTDIVASNLGSIHGDMGGWFSWEATSGSIVGLSTDNPNAPSGPAVAIGSIRLAAAVTAHNTTMLQRGKASGAFGVSNVIPSLPKLYFEARVRFNVAGAPNTADYFVGMATPGLCTANNTFFTTGDAVVTASMNAIGFTSINSATIKPMYMAAATPTNPAGTGTIPTPLTNWTKLGFVYDPYNVQALRYYQDGVLMASSAATPSSNWPSNAPLTPTICYQLGGTGTTDSKFDVDWLAVGQVLQVE